MNIELHRILDDASRSPLLSGILSRLSVLAALYVNHNVARSGRFRDDASEQHLQLVEAYRRRDPHMALDLYLRHLTATVAATRHVG